MKLSTAKQLALVLIVALALRLMAGWVWQARLDGCFGFGDSESYWRLARAIASGEPYGIGEGRAFRTPGYPLLLAPVFLLTGDEPSVMWARAESALLGTLSVGAVWWLGRTLFDARAGLVAASIAAVYPGAIAMGALVLSEAAFCPLMLLQLILWTAAWHARSARRAAVLSGSAGLVAGVATLVRPSWLLFVPFAIVVGLAAGKQRARHLGLGAMVLAGLVAAMIPWWVRNARLTGRFVPTTLQVGASLYDGLNAHATGASNMTWSDQATARFLASERALSAGPEEAQGALEYRLDRHLRAESLAWARAHPGRVAQLMAIKFARLWNFWPNEAAFSAWPIRLAVFMTYVPVMVLAIVGAWATIHRGWPYVLCWLPALYFTALHMVFVSSIRYRQPVMLALMVLAAGAIVARLGRNERESV
ncbi:MAG TPA: glycosyltransferase family 39 protein [Thermoguttaceae bacterium]|nr:glycosyltransferase family 39 protein [Thermoguttaceae bacterium]